MQERYTTHTLQIVKKVQYPSKHFRKAQGILISFYLKQTCIFKKRQGSIIKMFAVLYWPFHQEHYPSSNQDARYDGDTRVVADVNPVEVRTVSLPDPNLLTFGFTFSNPTQVNSIINEDRHSVSIKMKWNAVIKRSYFKPIRISNFVTIGSGYRAKFCSIPLPDSMLSYCTKNEFLNKVSPCWQ
jgi:hypothetical protein